MPRQRVKIPTRWSGARLGFSMSGVGSISAEQAVWNLPATLSVQQGGNIPLRQYALNSDGWQIQVSNLPAGVTYNSGLERLEGAATGTSSGTATFTLTRVGGSDVVATATVSLTDPSLIVPALTVEYVDSAGVLREESIVAGATISGVAPFLVHFDASGTRAPAAFAAQGAITDAEAYAFQMVGYRLNYGESVGGTWAYPEGFSYSRDEDTGPPIFGRAFTQVGTHVAQLRCRDALGNEVTLSFNVQVAAPPTATLIPQSAGAWPTWQDNTHYALEAGGTYTGFGPIDTRERHNILISKQGGGADPVVGTFRPDGRGTIDAPEGSWSLARHIRLLDIDCAAFDEGGVQFQYCGVVRGRCRTFNNGTPGKDFIYDNSTTNANTRNSVRRSRGVFLWDCGQMVRGGSNHCIIGGATRRHIYGVDFNLTGNGLSISTLRMYDHESSLRYIRSANTTADSGTQTWLVMIGYGDLDPYPYTVLPWDDLLGEVNVLNRPLKLPRKFIAHNIQLGRADGPWLNGPGSIGGPVNESWVCELFGLEDSVIGKAEPTAYGVTANMPVTGRHLFVRNVKYNFGAGGGIAYSADSGPDADFNGPRLLESTNTRPVPTSF